MPDSFKVAAIPGDGIGGEVVPGTIDLVDVALSDSGRSVDWLHLDWGSERYLRTGEFMPANWRQILCECDAILLGAVGDPRVPDHISLWGLLLPIRRELRQAINLRPLLSFQGVPGPLRSSTPFDVLVVRENNEGEYTSVGGSLYPSTSDEVVIQTAVFTRHGTERVVRYAFEQARSRRGELVSATKSNGLPHSMPFWDRVVTEVGEEFPDVRCRSIHVDALAARLVLAPHEFDVIVGSNLFGDILSDLGAALAGGIGVAASGNIDPTGVHPSMFEPVHGSAPDIAGLGIADPIGQVLSAALMLRHLGQDPPADALTAAVRHSVREISTRTGDLGGSATTERAFAAIRAQL